MAKRFDPFVLSAYINIKDAKDFILVERYTVALYKVAEKAKITDEVYQVLQLFHESYINETSTWKTFIYSPQLTTKQRINTIEPILKHFQEQGISLSSYTIIIITNFWAALATKNRLTLIPKLAAYFDGLIDQAKQKIHVNLIAAKDITRVEKDSIDESLEKYLESIQTKVHVGKKDIPIHIKSVVTINPEVLGGFIAEGNKMRIDASLAGSLERWSKLFDLTHH